MNRSPWIGLLKAVCCCLLLVGFSFIQVAPAAFADDSSIVEVKDSLGAVTGSLVGAKGNIYAGGGGHEGDLVLFDKDGKSTVHVDGGNGNIDLGGNGHVGDLVLLDKEGKSTVYVDGGKGNINAGGNGHVGDLTLFDYTGKSTVHVDGGKGNINLGGNGHDGDVVLLSDAGKARVEIEAYDSSARFLNSAGEVTIKIDGESGDIVVSGISFKSLLERIEALEKSSK